MIERGENSCLPLEARQPIAVARKQLRQHLDRDVAAQLRITGAIHFTHATGTDGGLDHERAEAGAYWKRHEPPMDLDARKMDDDLN